MIRPSQSDIGRILLYKDIMEHEQEAILTSFNEDWLVIRYRYGGTDVAVRKSHIDDITWTNKFDRNLVSVRPRYIPDRKIEGDM
jgi:hypothetical protein